MNLLRRLKIHLMWRYGRTTFSLYEFLDVLDTLGLEITDRKVG